MGREAIMYYFRSLRRPETLNLNCQKCSTKIGASLKISKFFKQVLNQKSRKFSPFQFKNLPFFHTCSKKLAIRRAQEVIKALLKRSKFPWQASQSSSKAIILQTNQCSRSRFAPLDTIHYKAWRSSLI